MSEDLYTGPSVLAPGPKEPSGTGHRIATVIVLPLLLVFTTLVLLFYVIFTRAVVDGISMEPTLLNKEYVLLTKGYDTPARGDVIVTVFSENGRDVELVKRVIGLPGDTVQISADVATVNGQPEPQRGQVVDARYAMSTAPYPVPAGYLFVMGDNRPVSEDSRHLGAVPISGVKGKVVAVFAPVNRIRRIR